MLAFWITRNGARACGTIALAMLAVLLNWSVTNAADMVDSKTTLEERHARVVKMSAVERERLERNLAEFQKMKPEQRDQYRQLNADLEENRNNGGNLNSLMQTYSAWLQTLTPSQREELRQETDSVKKMALVQRIKSEQVQKSFESSPSIETLPPANGPRRPPGRLSLEELNSMMEVLASELPAEQQEEIGRIKRLHQYPDILRRSIERAEDPREWPAPELQDKLFAKVPTHIKNFIWNNNRREMLAKLIIFSFVSLTMEEARPSPRELNLVYDTLDSDQQKILDQKPLPEQTRILTMKLFEQHPDRYPKQLKEMDGRVKAMMDRIGIQNLAPPRPVMEGQRPGADRRQDERRFGPGDQPPPERGRDRPRPEPRRDGRNEDKKDRDQ